MNFKEWLKVQETATSTSSVSNFSLPMGGNITRRMYPEPITFEKGKGKGKGKSNLKKIAKLREKRNSSSPGLGGFVTDDLTPISDFKLV
jgi:hypothetical protein